MKERKSEKRKLYLLVQTGMMTALICLLTALIHIPTPTGYIHCGDAMIYLAAVTLPTPYAVCAASLGGGLADFFSGYPAYILPTAIIKALLAIAFRAISGNQRIGKRALAAAAVCCLITIIGYWLAAAVLYGNLFAQLLETTPGNLIQGIGSAVLYFGIVRLMKKSGEAVN